VKDALLTGRLVLNGRCLQVQSAQGLFLAVWPVTARLEREPSGGVRIRDARTGATIRPGDEVDFGGGALATNFTYPDFIDQPFHAECSGFRWQVESFNVKPKNSQ